MADVRPGRCWPRPGSAAWLLQHELRLAGRGIGLRNLGAWAIAAALLWLLLHAAAYPLLSLLRGAGTPASAMPMVGAMTWLVMSLMLSQAILLSVSALFVRGDLDLLLASPIPPRSVFIVRGLGVAVSSTVLYLVLLSPLANLGPFTGRPGLLAIYPTMLALGLGMTALGIAATLGLVWWIGARRARTAAQLLGAFIGAAVFLVMQAQNMLAASQKRHIAEWLRRWTATDGPLAPDSLWWWPGRAMMGEPLPLALLVVLGIGSFTLVIGVAERRFVTGTQGVVTGGVQRADSPAATGPPRLRPGLRRNVLVKEWRLIWRDPQLIAQALLQTLYLLPLMFLAFRHQDTLAVVVPGAVLFGTSLAGALAWITVAAEEAPELIGSAPVTLGRVRWMKLVAALAPVGLLLLPLLVLLLVKDPLLALVFVGCAGGGCFSAGMMQLWYPRQGDRRDMKKSMQGGVAVRLLETFDGMAWAATAWCLIAAWGYAPWALATALSMPAAVWWLGRARREANELV